MSIQSININSNNIIETQYEQYVQSGGYEEMTHNQIIHLWQNPDYNKQFINYYSLVSKYLRKEKFVIRPSYLQGLKIKTNNEFYEFMIYYINKLTNIIYKSTSQEKKYFFRGEHRKNFNYKVGDTLFYPSFQSITTSISTAYKFSESGSKSEIKLLFVILIDKGFHYKTLTTRLKLYNYKDNITKYVDEKEYLVLTNSYYTITEIITLEVNFFIVKLKLFYQEYYQIENGKLYEQSDLSVSKIETFTEPKIKEFIVNYHQYKKLLTKLSSLSEYEISDKYYSLLSNVNLSNIFVIPIDLISKISQSINTLNIKEKALEIKELGLGYNDGELDKVSNYMEKILSIVMIRNIEYKSVKKMTVYCGHYNLNKFFKKDPFVQYIKKAKNNELQIYNDIIITNLSDNKYLYSDIYNNEYPHTKIKKDSNIKLMYYKYHFKFNLSDVKISVCGTHNYESQNNIILIPNFSMEIINKKKFLNKYNLKCELYEINVKSI
jgi:hypothetical protein